MKKILICSIILILFSISISATEPAIWSITSRNDIIKGDAKGVSINDNGSITLAPKLTEVFKSDQSFIWSTAVDSAGNIFLGTGGEGKIFKVDERGKGTLFYDSAELNVTAIVAAKDGSIYAGTSPDGKVYRINPNGTASVYFEPQEKYIWSLAVFSDGSLAVGTGENGKIYKVKSANANPINSLFFDTSETHIISMATDNSGNLYAGTDSEGLVLRFSADGKPFALLDSTLREIHEISVADDGSIYVLALSESATAAEPKTEVVKKETKNVSVESKKGAIPTPPTPEKSRYDLTAAKSAVYRILPDGENDIIWNSDSITAFSIQAKPDKQGVLIGTSDKGRIYSVTNEARETLLLQTGEEQISTMKVRGNKIFATSSNQGNLYSFGQESLAVGTYESPVLDAKSVSNWGRIWWRSSGNVEIQTRSGNTAEANETWSDWSKSLTNEKGGQVSSPKAQYLQWRAILKNSNTTATVSEVNVSFLTRNISPEILSIEIFSTNIGLSPSPTVPLDANIKTLGLDPADFGIIVPPIFPQKVFQSGAKSIQWTAEDRNGDDLTYSIYYRQVGDMSFKLLRENVIETFFTVDALAIADGRYIFKIIASDLPSNPDSQALTGERISEPFDIDNTSPTVSIVGSPQKEGENVRIVFDAKEDSGYIKRAEYNINGGDWKTVYADDGISDGQTERYTVNVKLINPGDYSIGLRVFDSSGNPGNARVSIKK